MNPKKILKRIRVAREVIREARSLGGEVLQETVREAAEVATETRGAMAEVEALGNDLLALGRGARDFFGRLAPRDDKPPPVKVKVTQG